MKILYLYEKEEEKDYIKSHLSDYDITFVQGTLQDHPEAITSDYEVLSTFVSSKIGKSSIDAFPHLKFIATRSTGFDHIDLNEAHQRGIIVSNVPQYGSQSVAEHVFALMLSLAKNIHIGYEQVMHDFEFGRENLLGYDLQGKTIGVIGTGNIGKHVIHLAQAFGMHGLLFDIYKDEEFARHYQAPYVELDELYTRSDIISLHVPSNEHTHHMVNKKSISKMKDGVVLINTSRGDVIKSDDLLEALESGKVRGVGLDVLDGEKQMMNYGEVAKEGTADEKNMLETNIKLIKHPKSLVTPHIASQTKEANLRRMDTTIENIHAFAQGNPINMVKIQS